MWEGRGMFRLTLREVSKIINKSEHWVYANCYELGVRPVDWLFGAPELAALVRRAFLLKSYEKYPYEVLAGNFSLGESTLRESWEKHVRSPETACEFLFFLVRRSPEQAVSNHVVYLKRIAGDRHFNFWAVIKEYAFKKLTGLWLRDRAGDAVLGINLFGLMESGAFLRFGLKEELRKLIKN